MTDIRQMIELNKRQSSFYDSVCSASDYSENLSTNSITRLWASLRNAQIRATEKAGLKKVKRAKHLEWVQQSSGKRFLELGCFTGSDLTMDLAHQATSFVAVDLSPLALRDLEEKLKKQDLFDKCELVVGDILEVPLSETFDVIYAHGVLHHFEDPEPVFAKIHSWLSPHGRLILTEPLAINPFYRIMRSIYRPFQGDREWEWPFTRNTVNTLEKFVKFEDGFGWGRHSLLVSLLCGLPVIGNAAFKLYRRLLEKEQRMGLSSAAWQNSYITLLASPKTKLNAS
ncbi:MAG: class I SAM-dependent methyltransferase [Verrucomicrobiota bacterium]